MLWRCSTYTHERSMDVFIKVTEVIKQTPKGAYLMVQWWNRGQGQGSYVIDSRPEPVFILAEDYVNWRYFIAKEKS